MSLGRSIDNSRRIRNILSTGSQSALYQAFLKAPSTKLEKSKLFGFNTKMPFASCVVSYGRLHGGHESSRGQNSWCRSIYDPVY